MDLHCHPLVDITMLNSWKKKHSYCSQSAAGFTLVELLIASFIAALIAALTWNIMIESYKGDVRAESRRRTQEDWDRARSLIQSEMALSDLIEHSNLTLSDEDGEREGCNLLKEADNEALKLRMYLLGTLPEIIYGVRRIGSLPDEEARNWNGGPEAGILVRCGPPMTFTENGKIEYVHGKYQQSIVLDNINLSAGGLTVNPETSSEKLVNFTLNMYANNEDQGSGQRRTKALRSAGMSRINEIPPIPSDLSICERICTQEDYWCGVQVITLLKSDAKAPINYPDEPDAYTKIYTQKDYVASEVDGSIFGTDSICTNRPYLQGVTLAGSNGNYVIDGNPTPERTSNIEGVVIEGGSTGRNVLLGTPAIDTLIGGEKHDALIGRGTQPEFISAWASGDDLQGNAGDDSILPWSSTSEETGTITVDGGDDYDRVYLLDVRSKYTESSGCSEIDCMITSRNGQGILDLKNVEQIIYKDEINTLRQ